MDTFHGKGTAIPLDDVPTHILGCLASILADGLKHMGLPADPNWAPIGVALDNSADGPIVHVGFGLVTSPTGGLVLSLHHHVSTGHTVGELHDVSMDTDAPAASPNLGPDNTFLG